MTEKRKINRNLVFNARVFNRQDNKFFGLLMDITADGMRLAGPDRIESKKVFQLRMNLSEKIVGRTHVEFDAKSAWCSKDFEAASYNTGYQLMNVPPGDVKVIEELIRKFCA